MLETAFRPNLQGLMTTSHTQSFTRTNARHIASKVAADLRQMRLFYECPTETEIQEYLTEFVEHLVNDYLEMVEYGFRRDGKWVVSVRYEVRADGTIADTSTGGLYARADIEGAEFHSYLTRTSRYSNLSSDEKQKFKDGLPVKRSPGQEPGHTNGYWETGKSYASGGVGAERKMWRPL